MILSFQNCSNSVLNTTENNQNSQDYLIPSTVVYENCNQNDVVTNQSILKVPMLDCLRLVEKYSIEMKRGKGFVNMKNAIGVLETIFETSFREENIMIKKNISKLMKGNAEFKLILESLKEFRTIQMEGDKPMFTGNLQGSQNIKDIDYLAQHHFPLCMYEMYKSFKKEKHLKHMGRLQFILFMRGVGFKFEDVMNFFKNVVTKGNNSKKLKEYEYSIKHSFGMVGSKTEYSGMGCPKIISLSRPSKGDVHGCPFDYYSDDSLWKLLNEKLNNEIAAQEVIESRSMGAKFGCRKYFCKKKGTMDIEDLHDGIGKHPNLYFSISCSGGKRMKKKEISKPQDKKTIPIEIEV